jgi:hypothetical protein
MMEAKAKPGVRTAKWALITLAIPILGALWIASSFVEGSTAFEVVGALLPMVIAGLLILASMFVERSAYRMGLLVLPIVGLGFRGLQGLPVGVVFLVPAGFALASALQIRRSETERIPADNP